LQKQVLIQLNFFTFLSREHFPRPSRRKTDGKREKNNKSLLAFPSNSINHKNTFNSVA
jgi:hypothetical protein